ncbi:hypothetical protein [Streptomyces sp. NBC_01465]|uniref:hypothetical protein n=1 Tax=Streptomyces sp. NBC_01465 TaxID=2903878 RepID=UPI002E3049A9|nr:hypothetical protein [Streptomyces sp. NBC_01465]
MITAVTPGAAWAGPVDGADGVERVSVAADGTQANDDSAQASITPAGDRVVFSSYANNLTPGNTGRNDRVFVRDLATGQNRQFDGSPVGPPMLSSDGQVLAYLGPRFDHMALYQNHLSLGWSTSYTCSLLRCEASMGASERQQAFGVSFRYPEQNQRVEVRSPDTGELQTVDIIHNTASIRPSLSGDGTRLAYQDGGEQDILLWDWADNTVVYPIEGPGKAAELVQLSDDGSKVVYLSGPDTYVYDVASGTALQVPGAKGIAIDPTGRYLLHTPSGTTGPAPLTLRDLETGTDETVTDRPATAGIDTVSAGGRQVIFQSTAEDLVPEDTNGKADIFVRTLR